MQELWFIGSALPKLIHPVPLAQLVKRHVLLHLGHYVIAFLLLLVMVAATPSGSSTLSPMLNHLGLRVPSLGWAVGTAHEIPIVTLEEAQKQASFKMHLPTWLPNGLTLGGAHVLPDGTWANTFYIPSDAVLQAKHAGMGLAMSTKPRMNPSQDIPNAFVNGHPANYETTETYSQLSWEQDGLSYSLGASNLNLTRAELIRIAESLR